MQSSNIELTGLGSIPAYTTENIIIGSGAAGLNCAEHLHELGRNFAIVTDCLGAGTSNNSGSDKQTYYKMGVFGDVPDSPIDFAKSLFNGGMCHGDLAYIEALGSLPEFFHLVRNGVEFPCNAYGAYVGYKTDHDPRQRATSAGPKTSIQMVQQSLKRLRQAGAQFFDGYEVIRLLTTHAGRHKRVVGAVAINRARLETPEMGLTIFFAENVIMATGGPGELYETSVYPYGQIGNHGLALEIGAQANNLSESQFGLASIGFRWNLSGTYQQVIPSYFSEDSEGNRYDFLADYYRTPEEIAGNIFLKGYQWPFHAQRLQEYGSSLVDIAVNEERMKGRRVYMDFTRNVNSPARGGGRPGRPSFDLRKLPREARTYLERSGATQATPLERLMHMNPLAIELYAEHCVDLRQPLEVAVCAQHCNGGLTVNSWWQTTISNLFAIGEVAGTHGVRPGGSALNAGQVGGLRAAQYIAAFAPDALDPDELLTVTRDQIIEEVNALRGHLSAGVRALPVAEVRAEIQRRMSEQAAFVRTPESVQAALADAHRLSKRIKAGMSVSGPAELPQAVQNHHLCQTHIAFLSAINDLISRGGGSRGAYVIVDRSGNSVMHTVKGPRLPHRPENIEMRQEIIEVRMKPSGVGETWTTPVRPLPQDDSWYETTWQAWREGKIYEPQE
jgi:succinate dehydrogenase/fumarate reductase flavoprotein subunit